MNKKELKNLYLMLNKELDIFNFEFFLIDGDDSNKPYTLNEFIHYLTHDNHIFDNDIQPYRDRVFK